MIILRVDLPLSCELLLDDGGVVGVEALWELGAVGMAGVGLIPTNVGEGIGIGRPGGHDRAEWWEILANMVIGS